MAGGAAHEDHVEPGAVRRHDLGVHVDGSEAGVEASPQEDRRPEERWNCIVHQGMGLDEI